MTQKDTTIRFVRGETVLLNYLFSQDGTPLNLAGASASGQIRDAKTGDLSATFSMTITDAGNGTVAASMSASITATLDDKKEYVYDHVITYPSGTKHVFARGKVLVERRITE